MRCREEDGGVSPHSRRLSSEGTELSSEGTQHSAEGTQHSSGGTPEASGTATAPYMPDGKVVCHVSHLPNELLLHVFSFLTQKELCLCVAPVCRAWRELSADPSLWTRLIFPKHPTETSRIRELITTRARHLLHIELQSHGDGEQLLLMLATHCPRLRHLTFNFCDGVTEHTAEALTQGCPELRYLSLEGSQVTTARCYRLLAKLTHLTFLNLSHCRDLDDAGLMIIANSCRHLQYLDIDGITSIHDTSVVGLAKLLAGSLHHLLLDGENLSDMAYKALGACTQLKSLGVSFCEKMTDAGLTALSPLTRLTWLKLRKGTQLRPSGMNAFIGSGGLTHLTHLNLGECTLLDDNVLLSVATSCPALLHLELNWCWDVTDAGLALVAARCSQLRVLVLVGVVQLTSAILPILIDALPDLLVLDLEQCNAIDDVSLHALVVQRPSLKVFDYWGDTVVPGDPKTVSQQPSPKLPVPDSN